MNQKELRIILTNLYKNKISPADAIKKLQNMPYENIDFAKIDVEGEELHVLQGMKQLPNKIMIEFNLPKARQS